MNDSTRLFLIQAYKEYYFKGADRIEFPQDVGEREFGYIPFSGGMVRHLSFKHPGEAVAEILRQGPSSVYCSNARYASPTAPMEEKGWKGAELIFDIDATDIPTACKKGHDLWYCQSCFSSGKLPKPAVCPTCKGTTDTFHGTCNICLEAAKEHTLRVSDFLTGDFGVSQGDIRNYFSGNRGYHIHVYDHRFDLLDSQARAEIAEYIKGSSLPPSNTIWAQLRRISGTSVDELQGWTRRIASDVGTGYGENGRPSKSIAQAIASQSARIDASVTTDIHRVFRLAGTLHGNTGMLKMRVQSFDRFDPYSDPVVLSEEKVTIQVEFYPRFSLKGESFGPFKSQKATLPTYAAIGIITRGFAEVA